MCVCVCVCVCVHVCVCVRKKRMYTTEREGNIYWGQLCNACTSIHVHVHVYMQLHRVYYIIVIVHIKMHFVEEALVRHNRGCRSASLMNGLIQLFLFGCTLVVIVICARSFFVAAITGKLCCYAHFLLMISSYILRARQCSELANQILGSLDHMASQIWLVGLIM